MQIPKTVRYLCHVFALGVYNLLVLLHADLLKEAAVANITEVLLLTKVHSLYVCGHEALHREGLVAMCAWEHLRSVWVLVQEVVLCADSR